MRIKDEEIAKLEEDKLNEPNSEKSNPGQIANQTISLALIRALKDKHSEFPQFSPEEYKSIYEWVNGKTSKISTNKMWCDWTQKFVLELSENEKPYAPYVIADRLTLQRKGGIFAHFVAFPFEEIMKSIEAKKREFCSDDHIMFFKFKRIVDYCRSYLKQNSNQIN